MRNSTPSAGFLLRSFLVKQNEFIECSQPIGLLCAVYRFVRHLYSLFSGIELASAWEAILDLTVAAIAMFLGAVALAMLGIIGNKNLSDLVKVALILAITILSYGFLNRYQQVRVSDSSVVSVVDGLTGQVTFCYSSGCRNLK